jgi:hypothetical protein
VVLLAREEGLGPEPPGRLPGQARGVCLPWGRRRHGLVVFRSAGRNEVERWFWSEVNIGWFDFSAFGSLYFPSLFLLPSFFLLPSSILFGRLPWRRRRGHA